MPWQSVVCCTVSDLMMIAPVSRPFGQWERSAACAQNGLAREIVAFDPNDTSLNAARDAGIVDQGCASAQEAVVGADAVVLAAPIRATDLLSMGETQRKVRTAPAQR